MEGRKTSLVAANTTILAILNFSLLCSGEASSSDVIVRPKVYDLTAIIQPEKGQINVEGQIAIDFSELPQGSFSFNIHETFTVDRLSIEDGPVSYSSVPNPPTLIVPASKRIVVELPTDFREDSCELEISYQGVLKDIPEFGSSEDQKSALDDQINSDLVELALYSAWYPQFEIGTKFDVSLEVSLPHNWIAVCTGSRLDIREIDRRSITRWTATNDMDVVIVASPRFKKKTVSTAFGAVEVYYTALPESYIERESSEIEESMALFSGLLGKPGFDGGSIRHVFSPKRRGQGGAGIARPGLIVTSEGRTRESLEKNSDYSMLQGLAHEIAHFWWNFGIGQADWFNEAFAEYFSLVAVGEIGSRQRFEKRIAQYRKWVDALPEDAPSLSKVPFSNDNTGFVVRYYKGSLMLHRLRSSLGEPKFFDACRAFHQTFHTKGASTEDFRAFWSELLGRNQEILAGWLDSTGGVPEFN